MRGRAASRVARVALGASLISVAVFGQAVARAQSSGPVIASITLDGVVDPFTAD